MSHRAGPCRGFPSPRHGPWLPRPASAYTRPAPSARFLSLRIRPFCIWKLGWPGPGDRLCWWRSLWPPHWALSPRRRPVARSTAFFSSFCASFAPCSRSECVLRVSSRSAGACLPCHFAPASIALWTHPCVSYRACCSSRLTGPAPGSTFLTVSRPHTRQGSYLILSRGWDPFTHPSNALPSRSSYHAACCSADMVTECMPSDNVCFFCHLQPHTLVCPPRPRGIKLVFRCFPPLIATQHSNRSSSYHTNCQFHPYHPPFHAALTTFISRNGVSSALLDVSGPPRIQPLHHPLGRPLPFHDREHCRSYGHHSPQGHPSRQGGPSRKTGVVCRSRSQFHPVC